MVDRATEQLIVCAGVRVNPTCASAMEAFLATREADNYLFVMSDWLAEDQFCRAALLWVVDDSASRDTVDFALRQEIPVLVPENNAALKNICVKANCGLYYQNAADAQQCLELLLIDEALRRRLGGNGYLYAHSKRAMAAAR